MANKKLEDTFDMSTMHIIMMDKNISNANKTTLMKDIEKVDGVKWAFGLNSVFGANVPASMIPKDVKDMLQSDEQELVFVCSKYSSATDESNSQIAAINDLVKKYDSNGMVIGEAPLMKDLPGCNGHRPGKCKRCLRSSYFYHHYAGIQIHFRSDHSGCGY